MKEQILHELQNNSSVFAINLKNIAKNYHCIAKKAPNKLVFPAIKANAYGIGAKEVAKHLIKEGCKGFFVFTEQEALEIYDKNVTIYVLGCIASRLSFYQKYPNIIPVLYKNNQLSTWLENKNHTKFAVQVETGLNRQGISADFLLNKIAENKENLKLDLVLSHLACATEPLNSYNNFQLQNYLNLVKKLPKTVKTSLSATYSMFVDDSYNFDIIRPGIALFGGKPILQENNNPMLPVAHLCGKILQIHQLKKGEKSGYDGTEMPKDGSLAIVSMGYADGVLRQSGNGKAYLTIQGHKAPIFGIVSMDTTIIDVSKVPKQLVHEGALVEFYGEFTKINDVATSLNDNPCNIIIHAGLRAKRIYID